MFTLLYIIKTFLSIIFRKETHLTEVTEIIIFGSFRRFTSRNSETIIIQDKASQLFDNYSHKWQLLTTPLSNIHHGNVFDNNIY